MAERLDVADKKSLSFGGYESLYLAAHSFVTATVGRIINELNRNTPNRNMEKIDLYLSLICQQLNKVEKWNETDSRQFTLVPGATTA